jgi:hypothetical protein
MSSKYSGNKDQSSFLLTNAKLFSIFLCHDIAIADIQPEWFLSHSAILLKML